MTLLVLVMICSSVLNNKQEEGSKNSLQRSENILCLGANRVCTRLLDRRRHLNSRSGLFFPVLVLFYTYNETLKARCMLPLLLMFAYSLRMLSSFIRPHLVPSGKFSLDNYEVGLSRTLVDAFMSTYV